MDRTNQPTADEKLAQLLRAAALETDSDKLLELYRAMARLNEEKLNEDQLSEEKSNPKKLSRENDTPSPHNSSR